jgi:hypothetical protein
MAAWNQYCRGVLNVLHFRHLTEQAILPFRILNLSGTMNLRDSWYGTSDARSSCRKPLPRQDKTNTEEPKICFSVSSGIQPHDPNVQEGQDISCLRLVVLNLGTNQNETREPHEAECSYDPRTQEDSSRIEVLSRQKQAQSSQQQVRSALVSDKIFNHIILLC